MRNLQRDKKGQFVIIAFLMMAIMMISMGAIIHRAGTYYKHEPWEEYLTLVSDIEVNSRRLVDLSLANYTSTMDPNILTNNLRKWQTDLNTLYPAYGIALNPTLTYMNYAWNQPSSYSAANASIDLSINSIGLAGYKFTATSFLKLTIRGFPTTKQITLTVEKEKNTPIIDLTQDSFQVNGYNITSIYSQYETSLYVYTLTCDKDIIRPITVNVWDQRGIQVTAKF